mgnify:CR=1 FL=1
MKRIIKGQEPSEWTYHRLQPQADYDSADAESKEALRLSLLRDQGFVCAYCGRRIPCRDSKMGQTDSYVPETSKIEHIIPQNAFADTDALGRMDYHNLVVCCPGSVKRIPGISIEKSMHCDSRKKNRMIHFSPLSSDIEKTLSYITNTKDPRAGAIISSDETIMTEIGGCGDKCYNSNDNILNLNHPTLRESRISVVKGIIQSMKIREKKNKVTIEWLEKILRQYENKTIPYSYVSPLDGTQKTYEAYMEFRGIAIYYLTKKIRSLSKQKLS